MLRLRAIAALGLVVAALAALSPSALIAQGVTTGAVTGVVTDEAGQGVENAQIQVTNRATGYTSGGLSRVGGRYFVQGLDVGNRYAVTVRLLGIRRKRSRIVSSSALDAGDLQLAPPGNGARGVTFTATPASSAVRKVVATITHRLVLDLPALAVTHRLHSSGKSRSPRRCPHAGGAYTASITPVE